jgi:hypothetical protein
LQITKDIERFACAHCGKEHLVKRGGGIIALAPVIENMSKGVDSTASELALVRLEKELADIKPKVTIAKEKADRFTSKAGDRVAVLIVTIVVLIGSILLFILTDLTLLAMIVLMVGIVLIGQTYHLHSKEFREEVAEALDNYNKLKEQRDKLKSDYQFHHDRANTH